MDPGINLTVAPKRIKTDKHRYRKDGLGFQVKKPQHQSVYYRGGIIAYSCTGRQIVTYR